MKKVNLRRTSGLRRWNKIFSLLIKNYKKKGVDYNIADVRKEASKLLSQFKKVAPSKITNAKVQKAKTEKEIKAGDIPEYYFEGDTAWFLIGDKISTINNLYPSVPIIIQSKNLSPLNIEGKTGNYSGSILQEFVENFRENLENEGIDSTQSPYPTFLGAVTEIQGKEYAIFYELGTPIPKVAPPVTDLEPRKKVIIDEIEEKAKQKKKKPKKRKKPLPKKEKKKKLPKPVKTKEKDTDYAKEIRGLINDLRQDVKDGLITKKFYQKKVDELTKKLKKGGKI